MRFSFRRVHGIRSMGNETETGPAQELVGLTNKGEVMSEKQKEVSRKQMLDLIRQLEADNWHNRIYERVDTAEHMRKAVVKMAELVTVNPPGSSMDKLAEKAIELTA